MPRTLLTVLMIVALVAPSAIAASRDVGKLSDQIELLASDPDRTVLRFEAGQFQLVDVNVDGQTWSVISWNAGEVPLDRGRPALPAFHESIAIPDDAKMQITVLAAEYQDHSSVRIAPSKGPISRDILPQDVPWEFGEDYERDAWYPEHVASVGDPYILRDVRGTVVTVAPFQWNPVTQTLRVWTRVDVEVKAVGPGETNVLTYRPAERVSEFETIYADHFLNYGAALRYATVGEVGRMIVIAYDDFAAAAQPLVDWKNQMGMETRLVLKSEIGTSASQFKAYIQNAYDNDGVCFIILVGDAMQIPYYVNDGGAADPMMTLLAGTDSYPDAFIGRISAGTVAQVQTQVERIVEYERNPDPAGEWYARGIAIASNEGEGYGDDGEADWEHARNYRVDLQEFTYSRVDELYDGTHPSDGGMGQGTAGVDQAGDPTAQDVSTILNQGSSLVHYTGHGSTSSWSTTGFSISSINALTNDNELPFVVSVGCVNGAFESGTCFAEAWLQATNAGEPTGAVACYASTVNQQWATPMRAQDEMIDLMCQSAKRTYGGLCFNGSCDMIDHYGAAGITEFKNWTVFGDPSLRVRTSVPQAVAVSHAGVVDADLGVFAVTTAPFALAALSAGGAFIGSAFADGTGLASMDFDPADLTGLTHVTLTVTGFNLMPSVEDVPVGAGSTGVPVIAGGAWLGENRPNPFVRSTSISFVLEREQAVRLEVFDVAGRRVRALDAGTLSAGDHAVTWNGVDETGRRVPAGSYFYRLKVGDRVQTRRLVLLR